ncbi:hypothetical protein [Rothia nasimurium]|uniref:hypothetical protein n=1 Tax=Rothia nasimurium TaxID=85336 RepID=UPI001F25C9D0|nr:hypothetical protein [Rothia nasimurium]
MVTTRSQLAQQMKVRPNGIDRMIREGTLPVPSGLASRTPYWDDKVLDDWFSHLQPEQSAYAPAKGVGTWEFQRFNAYICPVVQGTPDTAGWISSRRPSYLALSLEKYSAIQVFEVLWMETQSGVRGEGLVRKQGDTSVYSAPWKEIQETRQDIDIPLVYFQLNSDSIGEVELETSFRRGGTIATSHLFEAVERGRATGFRGGRVIY